MIRIGIVGSDNSHAIAFSKLCNLDEQLHLDGAQVTALFGLDPARNKEVAEAGRIPKIVEKPEEMIGNVDAVLVVFRHGDLHRQYAEPFLRARIPTFIDKPLAIRPGDARTLLDLAEETGTPLTSFSTFRYARDMLAFKKEADDKGPVRSAVFSGPADRESEYGGLPFYGVHLVEMAQALLGTGVERVHAAENKKNLVATLHYDDGQVMTLNFLGDAAYVFHMLAFGKQGWVGRALDSGTCYFDGLQVVLSMVRTGTMPLSREELLEPVLVLAGVERSLGSGQAVKIAHI
jgi:predicted dehydrogenase